MSVGGFRNDGEARDERGDDFRRGRLSRTLQRAAAYIRVGGGGVIVIVVAAGGVARGRRGGGAVVAMAMDVEMAGTLRDRGRSGVP